MLSITTNEPLITSTQLVQFDELYPHEDVVVERQNALYKYLESLKPYAILPSIIICDKTNVIIDGHHRYISLIELGFKMIPTTKVNYKNKSIITHIDNKLLKEKIIDSALSGKPLKPKSSFHHIIDYNKKAHPIILISSLFKLDFKK